MHFSLILRCRQSHGPVLNAWSISFERERRGVQMLNKTFLRLIVPAHNHYLYVCVFACCILFHYFCVIDDYVSLDS